MAVEIVAVTNRKGGVGKTTISTHIAAGLAMAGARVGLIDTDSQGHAGVMLGMVDENGRPANSLFEALIEKRAIEDVVQRVPASRYMPSDQDGKGDLFLMASSNMTYRIPYEMSEYDSFLFFERIEEMIETFRLDVVMIDTSPTLSGFDGALYLAADAFLYVTECELLSADGLQSAMEQMLNAQRARKKYLNRQSRILGIVPNKLRANLLVHRQNIRELAQAFPGLVWPPVTLRKGWVEASNAGIPVYALDPNGQEARDANLLVQRTGEGLGLWQTVAK